MISNEMLPELTERFIKVKSFKNFDGDIVAAGRDFNRLYFAK
jgi:hypothetical protein